MIDVILRDVNGLWYIADPSYLDEFDWHKINTLPYRYYEFNTLNGDGEFTDSEDRRFFVDTGRLCFVQADCAKPKKDIVDGGMHKVNIQGTVIVSLDTCKIRYIDK